MKNNRLIPLFLLFLCEDGRSLCCPIPSVLLFLFAFFIWVVFQLLLRWGKWDCSSQVNMVPCWRGWDEIEKACLANLFFRGVGILVVSKTCKFANHLTNIVFLGNKTQKTYSLMM